MSVAPNLTASLAIQAHVGHLILFRVSRLFEVRFAAVVFRAVARNSLRLYVVLARFKLFGPTRYPEMEWPAVPPATISRRQIVQLRVTLHAESTPIHVGSPEYS